MPIRLSGLSSGLDTESLVSALVSSYTLQKDNLVKAQTKLSWKQESWKTMNKSIYSFYTGKLSSFRWSKNYNLKTASVSNSSYAKVTASSSAVNGTQTLKVNKLAATGYLTGGVISATDENGSKTKLTGDSKLTSVTGIGDIKDGKISVSVDGSIKDIEITDDMTVNNFVTQLKATGLNVNFDSDNQRFFISAAKSGESHDFSIVANNQNGLNALKGLGIYTTKDSNGNLSADMAEYTKWAKYSTAELDAIKQSAYESKKINYADRAKSYADKYNAAKKVVDTIDADDTWAGIDNAKAKLSKEQTDFVDKYKDYVKKDDDGNDVKDSSGNLVYDTDKLEKDGKLTEYNAEKKSIDALNNNITTYETNKKTMEDTASYVTIKDDGSAVAATADDADTSAYDKIVAEVDKDNAKIKSDSDAAIDAKVAFAKQMVSSSGDDSTGAVRITGSDSEIVLNGATFKNNTNNFSINGLTIQATALTGNETVSITTDTDTDGIYKQIKDFFKDYNELIKAMDTAYNADSSKGYEPLTSDEKEAMTDDEVKEWEKKIKDSLLRKDSTLGNTSTAMKTIMSSSIEVNGKKYSLSSFGIKTQGYFSSSTNEKGVFHIDGDSDDSVSSSNEDKLRAALASDPDTVVTFFSKLSTNLYNDLTKRMASTSMSSIYTIYNDKQMASEYSTYTTKISDKESEISTWEDYYYNKFSKMESALAKLNQTQSSLSGYFS